MKKKFGVDFDFATTTVPQTARRGFWSLFVVMVGFTFFSASMWAGATLGHGLNLSGFIGALLIGGLILMVYTSTLAYVGSKTGLSMDLLARRSFGAYGSYLPSAMIGLTQLGWFGVGVAMLAYPIAGVINVHPWVIVVIGGLLMTSTAYWGIKAITILSFVSVPAIAVLGTISVTMASTEAGGILNVFSDTRDMTMFAGVAIVVGSFISGGTATPNFVRFSRTAKIAVITTAIAFFLGNSLMFIFGAVGGAFAGDGDIFHVMMAQGLLIPAIIILGLNIWTTNDSGIYSAGLGLTNITKVPRKFTTLGSGILGTILAVWLYYNFVGWLIILSTALPPIGVILALDYFFNKEKYSKEEDTTLKVNWFAIAGVVFGAIAAHILGNVMGFGITAINGMVVAAIIYFIGEAVKKSQR